MMNQFRKPSNWQDFQRLCADLYGRQINDNNMHLHARQGNEQHGVDIVGRYGGKGDLVGIQCKLMEDLPGKKLTEKSVLDEIENAKGFEPPLSEFIIATTDRTRKEIQDMIEKINEEHRKNNLFIISLQSWDELERKLHSNTDLASIYCMGPTNTEVLQESIKRTEEALVNRIDHIKNSHNKGSEIDVVVKEAKELVDGYSPRAGLRTLERIKNNYWDESNELQKYKILTNLGVARSKVLSDSDGECNAKETATLFLQALQYNKNDEKALCNAAIGKQLLGKHDEAIEIAKSVLKNNETCDRAYSILITSSDPSEEFDQVLNKVPEEYRMQPHTADAIGRLLVRKGNYKQSADWFAIAMNSGEKTICEHAKRNLAEVFMQIALNEKQTGKISSPFNR